MDGGWLGPEGVGGSYNAPDYKTQLCLQPLSSSIHWRMCWISWVGLQFCSFPCKTVSEKPKREKLFSGCRGSPGEALGVGSTLVRRGAAGCREAGVSCVPPCTSQVAALSWGPEIMAARFRRQILHLCGFLFLYILFFFLLSSFCSLCCGGKFQPFQPFGSKLRTGAKLITESQQGSALITHEMLICWRVSSAPLSEPSFSFCCSAIPLADASQLLRASPGYFF